MLVLVLGWWPAQFWVHLHNNNVLVLPAVAAGGITQPHSHLRPTKHHEHHAPVS